MLFKKKTDIYLELIIDDIFKIIPANNSFSIKKLLKEAMEERKIKENSDLWVVVGETKIIEILSSYNLIISDTYETFKLTERGFLAKELGGFTHFLKYRRQELSATSTQRKINIGLLIIGAIGIFIPLISEWVKHNYFKDEPLKQPVHVVVDSSFQSSHFQKADKKIDTNQQQPKPQKNNTPSR